MKRSLLLLIATLLILPASAEAQKTDWSPTPLRSLCSSPTMDYCVSFLSWDFMYDEGLPPPGTVRWSARLEADVALFGKGFSTLSDPISFFFWAYTGPSGDQYMVSGAGGVTGPGIYRLAESSPAGYPYVPTVQDDISSLVFGVAGTCAAGAPGRGSTADACVEVEVPEPGTYLLMLSGILGLGLLAWRRKEDLAA